MNPPSSSSQVIPLQVRQLFDHARQLRKQGMLNEAIEAFREVIELQPDYVAAYNNLANALQAQGDSDGAEAVYQQALHYAPMLPVLHCNYGSLLLARQEYDAAIKSYQKALTLQADFFLAYTNLAKAYSVRGNFFAALQTYKAALRLKPQDAELYLDCGQLYQQYGFIPQAVKYYRRSLQLAASARGYNALGAALQDWGNLKLARASYHRALKLQPDFDLPQYNLAQLYENLGELETARRYYEQTLTVDAENAKLLLHLEMIKRRQADWSNYTERVEQLRHALERHVENDKGEAVPMLSVLSSSLSPALYRALAEQMARQLTRNAQALNATFTFPNNVAPERLKIGYLSPDFRGHAVGTLIADLFQYHERPDFEVFAYSLLPHHDEWTERVKAGCDHFIDVSHKSPLAIAQQIHADGIHILVDLAGYTSYARPLVLALKPAPIQLQYLGYPGTLGAEYVPTIIADKHLIPENHQSYYTEQLCLLPHAWVAAPMQIASLSLTRAEFGLPEKGMVYCCFNGVYKLEPHVFSLWMEILSKVPNSVLWLIDGEESGSNERLRAVAQEAGIAPERLVFAKKRSHEEYLALYRLADLFLDTLSYNAGATAVGAFSAGLPLLTCQGEHYATRMGSALCYAVGLPELVAPTPADYVEFAVQLGSSPKKRAALKRKLAKKLPTAPLFQPQQFVVALEQQYRSLWNNYCELTNNMLG
uniref:protein O-GlcNAc transferase n=1 Tax=Chlorobium chlorochromatii (strain CaD3) TaxID=340177 RepID=Q3ASM2_CHLCH